MRVGIIFYCLFYFLLYGGLCYGLIKVMITRDNFLSFYIYIDEYIYKTISSCYIGFILNKLIALKTC